MYQTLIALRLTRSRIGLAVFSDTKLEFIRCLNLPGSSIDDAAKSLRGILNWAIEQFEEPALALEYPEDRHDLEVLIVEIQEFARDKGLPLREVLLDALLKTYAFPHLTSRSELRKIAASIWPSLTHTRKGEMLDAAALGLYVQVERLLAPETTA